MLEVLAIVVLVRERLARYKLRGLREEDVRRVGCGEDLLRLHEVVRENEKRQTSGRPISKVVKGTCRSALRSRPAEGRTLLDRNKSESTEE